MQATRSSQEGHSTWNKTLVVELVVGIMNKHILNPEWGGLLLLVVVVVSVVLREGEWEALAIRG